jgi:hypothetical protein
MRPAILRRRYAHSHLATGNLSFNKFQAKHRLMVLAPALKNNPNWTLAVPIGINAISLRTDKIVINIAFNSRGTKRY